MTDETKDKDFDWDKFAQDQKERKRKAEEQRRVSNDKLVNTVIRKKP